VSILGRIARLEARRACHECRGASQRPLVWYPHEDTQPPVPVCCERCGRELTTLVKVIYEDVHEDGGAGLTSPRSSNRRRT
jgi:hypothetical protein